VSSTGTYDYILQATPVSPSSSPSLELERKKSRAAIIGQGESRSGCRSAAACAGSVSGTAQAVKVWGGEQASVESSREVFLEERCGLTTASLRVSVGVRASQRLGEGRGDDGEAEQTYLSRA
jgi:hypothetical protein